MLLPRDEKRILAARLAGCLADARDPASTTHSYADMIAARMFAITCGYEDCDELDVLRFDPAFKLACGRLPETGRDLMSQLSATHGRTSGSPSSTRGRSRMVQRPRPDLRGGCAAMRIPTVTP